MTDATMVPLALLPELLMLAGAVICLLTGSFLAQHRQWVCRVIAVAALVAAAVAAGVAWAGPDQAIYAGTFAVDGVTAAGRMVVAIAALLVVGLGSDELAGAERESETYTLILLAALGAVVLAGTTDLLVLAVGFLLASIPLYALIGLSRSSGAAEAALKTYLLGALTGIGLLLGVTVLYGVGGASRYDLLTQALPAAPPAAVVVGLAGLLGGLLFKAGAVPGHFWVPDAVQGATTTAAAFATTVPKIGGFLALYRVATVLPDTIDWRTVVAGVAAVTMTLGNLAAYPQTDARRLLGWSTVSQAGYLLMPVAVAGDVPLALPSLVLYLAGYAVSNVTAFAVLAAVPGRRSLADHTGLARAHPWLTAGLVVALLSMVGTPPTGVFAGKLTAFTAAWDGGLWWLTVVAAINTALSLFYYLRWIGPAFRTAHDRQAEPSAGTGSAERPAVGSPARPWAAGVVVLGALLTLAVGVGAGVGLR